MQIRKVDVAIIGTGTAGMTAYKAARAETDSVVLIEGGSYGTTCARVGCMPSKLLIAAADAAHAVAGASFFGIGAGPVSIDGRAVMERVRRERDRFVAGVLASVERIPEEARIRGQARFEAPGRLVIDDRERLEAGRIVIATGSAPHVPEFLREAGDRLLVNDDLFELETLPGSVAVFGPGIVGLELGQALVRLGVDVRMFGRGGGLGPFRDPAVRDLANEIFNQEFYLDTDARVVDINRTGAGVAIHYHHRDKGKITETFDYLLAATGRRPRLAELALENAGLDLDEQGLPRFDQRTLQCGTQPVFIAGDANNHAPLLHEAANEGRIAGGNAGRYPDVQPGRRSAPLAVVFTDPQIAAVGLNLSQAAKQCEGCYAEGEVSFSNQGRAQVMGNNRGLLRVYGEQGSGRFLGAEMFAPGAEHLAHLLAWSVEQDLSVAEMLAMPYYHPVLEEALRSALKDLHHRLHLGPAMADACMECGLGT